MKLEVQKLVTHEAPESSGLKLHKKNTIRDTAAHLNDLLDDERRQNEFEQSLMFS